MDHWGQTLVSRVKSDFRLGLIVFLGIFAMISIAPFGIYRFLNGDVFHGVVDFALVAIIGSVAIYGVASGQSLRAGIVMVVLYSAGASITAIMLGWEGFVWMYPAILASTFLATVPIGVACSIAMVSVTAVAGQHHFESTIQVISTLATYTLVGVFAGVIAATFDYQKRRLERLVEHDALTGALNRHSLDRMIESAVIKTAELKHTTSVLMLDLDHFKSINDEYGHSVGDKVLEETSKEIKQTCRTEDSVCRYGGEEFIVVLKNCAESDAIGVANKVRRNITRRLAFIVKDREITVSVGCCEVHSYDSVRGLLERVDKLLYRAKSSGRNKTCAETHSEDECEDPGGSGGNVLCINGQLP